MIGRWDIGLSDTRPIKIRDPFADAKWIESDTELRMRLLYIGVSPRELSTIDLDKLAEQYRLQRRCGGKS